MNQVTGKIGHGQVAQVSGKGGGGEKREGERGKVKRPGGGVTNLNTPSTHGQILFHPRFSVSLIFGAAAGAAEEEEGVPGGSALPVSSSIANTGGLVAKGDGTPAANPKADVLPVLEGPRLNPRFANPGAVGGGGLAAEAEGVKGGGAVPLLNSAHRGHLRFVSRGRERDISLNDAECSNLGRDRKKY